MNLWMEKVYLAQLFKSYKYTTHMIIQAKKGKRLNPYERRKTFVTTLLKKNCMVTGLNESNRPAQDNGVERMYYFYL